MVSTRRSRLQSSLVESSRRLHSADQSSVLFYTNTLHSFSTSAVVVCLSGRRTRSDACSREADSISGRSFVQSVSRRFKLNAVARAFMIACNAAYLLSSVGQFVSVWRLCEESTVCTLCIEHGDSDERLASRREYAIMIARPVSPPSGSTTKHASCVTSPKSNARRLDKTKQQFQHSFARGNLSVRS